MHHPTPVPTETDARLERLLSSMEQSQARYHRLERLHRATVAGVLLLCAGVLACGVALYAAGPASAQSAPVSPTPAPVSAQGLADPHWVDEALAPEAAVRSLQGEKGAAVSAWTREKAQMMRNALNAYKETHDPFHAIIIFLGDVQHALSVIPEMRDDMDAMRISMESMRSNMSAMRADMGGIRQVMGNMDAKMGAVPVMATEMQSMNAKIGVMAGGIDSTLGRTGRAMPFWMPW